MPEPNQPITFWGKKVKKIHLKILKSILTVKGKKMKFQTKRWRVKS